MGQAKRNSLRAQKRNAGEDFTRELVFVDSTPAYNKFRTKLRPEIDRAIAEITAAHRALELHLHPLQRTRKVDLVRGFAFLALNNLVLATHFTVSGYTQSAGHELRNFSEASAMMLLLTLDDQLERFRQDMAHYPAHDAPTLVMRKKILGRLKQIVHLDERAWTQFATITRKIYNHHSHSGAIALVLNVKFDSNGSTILGGEYDGHKRDQYRTDLVMIATGAMNLAKLAAALVATLSGIL